MFWTVRNILLINYFAGDRLGSPVFSGQVKGSYSRFSLHRLELGHVVAGDVALELAGVGPREPPLALRVVDDVEMLARFHNRFSQSRRRPLLGPSPG